MKNGHFFEKGPKKFHTTPPPHHHYSTPFLSVLHQNKAGQNFCKRRQSSIVERIIGLAYALPVQFLPKNL